MGVSFIFLAMFYNISFASHDLLDDSPPLIKIVDPIAGSTIPHDIVIVNGTSYDNESGIKKIEVLMHQYPFNGEFGFNLANPASYNNWSKWSIPIPIQIPGIYRILAHAEDKAGNENWFESTINVPFLTDKSNSTGFFDNNNSQTFAPRIAFVNPVFTEAAYAANAFYDFYAKYKNLPWGRIVTTDVNMLTAPIEKSDQVDPYSSYDDNRNLSKFSNIAPDNNHIMILNERLKKELPTTFFTVIRNEDVHNGYIFDRQYKNAYDVLILSHEEYATDSMYNNYKKFVRDGGTIIFLDANMFYAEVKYDKNNKTITLIKGHDWEYDGRSAKKSVGERWFYENRDWIGSNFLVSNLKEKIYFKNNPFNYTHFEENYVSNPNASILLNYEIETPHSIPHMENVTVATYDFKFGNGKVIATGLYGQNLVNNTAFLHFFESLLLDSIDKTNTTKFEDKVKDVFSNNHPKSTKNDIAKDFDKFGIAKEYFTKQGGREWYLDIDDPSSDPKIILQ
jgi:N,N-dimethylformamidase beta subunit-like protein